MKTFKQIYLKNNLQDNAFIVERFSELTNKSIYTEYPPREEQMYTSESSDGYRKGGVSKRQLRTMDVFRLDNPKLFNEILEEYKQVKNGFEKKHFKTITILDFEGLNLEIDERRKPSYSLNEGEYERHGLSKNIVEKIVEKIAIREGIK